MAHAAGPFDVKLTPQAPDGVYEDAQLGRLSLDELTGLCGKMAIIIDGKAHSYDFEYTIAAS